MDKYERESDNKEEREGNRREEDNVNTKSHQNKLRSHWSLMIMRSFPGRKENKSMFLSIYLALTQQAAKPWYLTPINNK